MKIHYYNYNFIFIIIGIPLLKLCKLRTLKLFHLQKKILYTPL